MVLLDVEKLREMWWSSSPLSLHAQTQINHSYTECASFWSSLWELQKSVATSPPKSILNQEYNFYSDCILRHPESHIAFSVIEEGGFISSWSYKKIQRCVNYQLKKWSKLSLKPQAIVVLIMPKGIDYIISLLTALRLGLTICYLPPHTSLFSKTYLFSLLDQQSPDLLILKNPEEKATLTSYPLHILDPLVEEEDTSLSEPYTYPASQVMQFSLSLHQKEGYRFVPLTAQTTYLHALREALFTLHLKPETAFSAPLSCPLHGEPFTSLSCFLAGASLTHISDEVLLKDPFILKDKKLQVVGVSQELLKLWSEYPGFPSKSLKSFYIPVTSRDFPFWQSFLHMNQLEKTPYFQVQEENAVGGFSLVSKPIQKDLSPYIKPNFGTPWHLKDLQDPTKNSDKGMGFFTPNNLETNYIVSQLQSDCLLVTTEKPARQGVTLPLEKIEKETSLLPFVKGCIAHTTPLLGKSANVRLTLLIFVDPLKNDLPDSLKQEWTLQIQTQLKENIGNLALAEHIEYFTLIPKMKKGVIDKEWCLEQYARGLLSKKNDLQLYQLLSMLKKSLQDAITLEN